MRNDEFILSWIPSFRKRLIDIFDEYKEKLIYSNFTKIKPILKNIKNSGKKFTIGIDDL